MSLEPTVVLSPNAVWAMRDLMPPNPAPEIGEPDLYRLALGIADEGLRGDFARAVLASPTVGPRFARVVARLRLELGSGGLGPEDLANLRRVGAFPGGCRFQDAAAVFPGAVRDEGSLLRLAGLGRVAILGGEADRRFALPSALSTSREPPGDEGADAGWKGRYVSLYLQRAETIDGLVAEERWSEGSVIFRQDSANLRAAWLMADELGDHEAVASFVGSMAGVLAETGAADDLASLATVGRRAADVLRRPRVWSRLLSYGGVVASRRGDSALAEALWKERVELNRGIGNPVGEADALMDLATQAASDGDVEGWRAWMAQAETAVKATGRADFAANLLAMRASEWVRTGDRDLAARDAEGALAALSGIEGPTAGLFVRTRAAKALAACGQRERALAVFLDTLSRCLSGGLGVQAAFVLAEIGGLFGAEGQDALGEACLRLARRIHRAIGTRHAEAAEAALNAYLGERAVPRTPKAEEGRSMRPWDEEAAEILETLRGAEAMRRIGRT